MDRRYEIEARRSKGAVLAIDEKGFTLTEILVVILIISILVVLTFGNLPMLMDQKNRAVCASNLRGISMAIFAYSASNEGNTPSNNSSISWWKEIYPAYCSEKSIFACPADRTGFSTPGDESKGKLSYGPLGWDASSSSASVFNKRLSAFPSPAQSVALSEYFSKNRSVSGMNAWNYPGTVANTTYYHYIKTKTSLLFLDGHVSCESQTNLMEKITAKEIINSFKDIPSRL